MITALVIKELTDYAYLEFLLQQVDTKVISNVMGYKHYYTHFLIFNG